MPDGRPRLVFTGPTALARAFDLLQKGGYSCDIVAAPAGGSPCGMALALAERDLNPALAVLAALGASPRAVIGGAGGGQGGAHPPRVSISGMGGMNEPLPG